MTIFRHKYWPAVKRCTGLDRVVGYTVTARGLQIIGSTGTVLLIAHFLTPIQQGIYYTLLSLMALQTIFELGFSFVILQSAAHESVHLTFHPCGAVEGDPVVHARLASILQLTFRWYLRAAAAFVVILLPLGIVFFSRRTQDTSNVDWLGPWISAVLATSITFLLTPFYSFLEGCKEIKQVAMLRVQQATMIVVLSWAAISTGHGLYACALVNLGAIAVGLYFLAGRRALLLSLLRCPVGKNGVSWRHEVWPFQWRTAVTWLCSYFTMQIFTPVLFWYRGAADAGKMGLTLSIVGILPVVVLSWIAPKATPFGHFVKTGRLRELDKLFFRTLKQSVALIALLAVACLGAVVALQHMMPKLAARMENPMVFFILLLTAIGSFVTQGMAVYLRSFKKEPYLKQSIAVAAVTLIGVLLVAKHWGNEGVAIVYFICTGIVGFAWSVAIFQHQRELFRRKQSPDPELATNIFVAN